MQNIENREHQQDGRQSLAGKSEGFGWGIFLLLTGTALLAERVGWFPSDIKWFLPIVLIAWGAAKIFAVFANRD
ncbi:MAG: DUF5668 domain-containing protein [Acidobacteriota bacterium]